MFRPLQAFLRSQKCVMRKLHSVRSLVVHILNFQRVPVVMRFIRIELIICSTSKVDRVKVHIYVMSHTKAVVF